MIPIGIFAKTFQRENVEEVCQAVKESGFRHMQFNMACAGLPSMPEEIPSNILKDIQKAVNLYDLSISGLSATFNMCHPNTDIRQDGLKKLEILASICSDIGVNLLTLCTGTRNPIDKWTYHPDNHTPEAWKDMVQAMESAIKIAEAHNIFLGIEPEHANIVKDTSTANRLLTEMQSSRLKIILDPANLFEKASEGEIRNLIVHSIDLLGPHIIMAHAKDRDLSGNFVAPGKGIIPFDFFISQLQKASIYIPLIAHGFAENEVASVSQFLNRL